LGNGASDSAKKGNFYEGEGTEERGHLEGLLTDNDGEPRGNGKKINRTKMEKEKIPVRNLGVQRENLCGKFTKLKRYARSPKLETRRIRQTLNSVEGSFWGQE